MSTLLKNNFVRWFFGPTLFFGGFFLIFIFGLADVWQGILASGIVLGLGIIHFALILPIRQKQLEKLDEVLSTILSHEVVYLHDDVFAGLSKKQRIKVAKKLIESPNLNSFELISDIALVRSALHLSEERIKSFISSRNFGMIGKISSKQLQIIESGKAIKSAELERAKNTVNFKQNREYVWIHRSPYLTKSDAEVDAWLKQIPYKKYFSFGIGALLVIISILCIGVFNLSPWLSMLLFLGLALAGLAYMFDPLACRVENSKTKIKGIIKEINNQSIVSIGSKCFEGISLAKRELVVSKLIQSNKTPNKKIIHGLAIVDLASELSEEEVRAALFNERRTSQKQSIKKSEKVVKKINVEIKTNCPSCGVAYREGVNFCTSCGTAKELD